MRRKQCDKTDVFGFCVDSHQPIWRGSKGTHGKIHGGGGGDYPVTPGGRGGGGGGNTGTGGDGQSYPSGHGSGFFDDPFVTGRRLIRPTSRTLKPQSGGVMSEEEILSAKLLQAARKHEGADGGEPQEYLDGEGLQDWTYDQETSLGEAYNKKGAVFHNAELGETRLVFPGTSNLEDVGLDLLIGAQQVLPEGNEMVNRNTSLRESAAMEDANRMRTQAVEKYPNSNFESIGHSLGGPKAHHVGAEFRDASGEHNPIKATLFNPAISAEMAADHYENDRPLDPNNPRRPKQVPSETNILITENDALTRLNPLKASKLYEDSRQNTGKVKLKNIEPLKTSMTGVAEHGSDNFYLDRSVIDPTESALGKALISKQKLHDYRMLQDATKAHENEISFEDFYQTHSKNASQNRARQLWEAAGDAVIDRTSTPISGIETKETDRLLEDGRMSTEEYKAWQKRDLTQQENIYKDMEEQGGISRQPPNDEAAHLNMKTSEVERRHLVPGEKTFAEHIANEDPSLTRSEIEDFSRTEDEGSRQQKIKDFEPTHTRDVGEFLEKHVAELSPYSAPEGATQPSRFQKSTGFSSAGELGTQTLSGLGVGYATSLITDALLPSSSKDGIVEEGEKDVVSGVIGGGLGRGLGSLAGATAELALAPELGAAAVGSLAGDISGKVSKEAVSALGGSKDVQEGVSGVVGGIGGGVGFVVAGQGGKLVADKVADKVAPLLETEAIDEGGIEMADLNLASTEAANLAETEAAAALATETAATEAASVLATETAATEGFAGFLGAVTGGIAEAEIAGAVAAPETGGLSLGAAALGGALIGGASYGAKKAYDGVKDTSFGKGVGDVTDTLEDAAKITGKALAFWNW